MLFRRPSQRVFDSANLDQRLRAGLVLHWIGGGSGNGWQDRSGYGKHITSLVGSGSLRWELGPQKQRSALRFPGGANYGAVSSFSLTTEKTVAFWIYAYNLGQDILSGASGYYPRLDVTNFSLSSGGSVIFAHGLSTGRWYHIAIAGDGGAPVGSIYYRDGVRISNQSDQTTGNITQVGFALDAVLDDFRVYNRMLSAAEVALLASPSFSPVSQPSRLFAKFAAVDITGSGSASFSATGAAISLADKVASGSGSLTVAAAGTGFADITGSGDGSFSVTATGVSLADKVTSGSASFTADSSGDGSADITGSGSASFSVSSDAIGLADNLAAGASSATFTATGLGSADMSGTGSSITTMTADAAGIADIVGSGLATAAITSVADGVADASGVGAAVVTFAADAVGTAGIIGSGSATMTVVASGEGTSDAAGSGIASASFIATGSGAAEVNESGSGSVSLMIIATGVGAADTYSSGSAVFTMSATGEGESSVTVLGGGIWFARQSVTFSGLKAQSVVLSGFTRQSVAFSGLKAQSAVSSGFAHQSVACSGFVAQGIAKQSEFARSA